MENAIPLPHRSGRLKNKLLHESRRLMPRRCPHHSQAHPHHAQPPAGIGSSNGGEFQLRRDFASSLEHVLFLRGHSSSWPPSSRRLSMQPSPPIDPPATPLQSWRLRSKESALCSPQRPRSPQGPIRPRRKEQGADGEISGESAAPALQPHRQRGAGGRGELGTIDDGDIASLHAADGGGHPAPPRQFKRPQNGNGVGFLNTAAHGGGHGGGEWSGRVGAPRGTCRGTPKG